MESLNSRCFSRGKQSCWSSEARGINMDFLILTFSILGLMEKKKAERFFSKIECSNESSVSDCDIPVNTILSYSSHLKAIEERFRKFARSTEMTWLGKRPGIPSQLKERQRRDGSSGNDKFSGTSPNSTSSSKENGESLPWILAARSL